MIYTAMEYNYDCVYIDASYSTGIIPKIVAFVHHTISYSIEIIPQCIEVKTTTAFDLVHKTQKLWLMIF